MLKKTFVLLLAVIICLSAVPAVSFTADNLTSDISSGGGSIIPVPVAIPTPMPEPSAIPSPIYNAPIIITPADGVTVPYDVIEITWQCEGQPSYYNVRLRAMDSAINSNDGVTFTTTDKYYKLSPERIKPNVKYMLDIGVIYNPPYMTTNKGDIRVSPILPPSYIKWSQPITFVMLPQVTLPTPTPDPNATPTPIPEPTPITTPIPTPIYDAPIIITPADGSTMPYDVIEITWKCEGQPSYYNVRLRAMDSAINSNDGITFTTSDKYYKLSPERIKPNVKYMLDIGVIYNPPYKTTTTDGVVGVPNIMPPSYIKWSQPITFVMLPPDTTPTPTPDPNSTPTPVPTPIPTPVYSAPIIITPADGSSLPYGVIEITWKCEGQPSYYNVRLRAMDANDGITFTTSDKYYKLSPEQIKPNVKYMLDIGVIYNPTFIKNTAGAVSGASPIMPPSYIKWSQPITFNMLPPDTTPTPTPDPNSTPTPAPTPIPTPVYSAPIIITPADGSSLPYGVIEITWKCEGQPSYYNVRLRSMDSAINSNDGVTFTTTDKYYKLSPERIKPNVKYMLDIGVIYNPPYMTTNKGDIRVSPILPPSYIKWSQPITFVMLPQVTLPTPTPDPNSTPTPTPTPIPTPIYSAPIIITPADGSSLPYGVIEITWKCEGQPSYYNVRLRAMDANDGITFTTADKYYKLSPERIKPNVKYMLDIGVIYNPTFIKNTAGAVSGASPIKMLSYIRWSQPITFVMLPKTTLPTPQPEPTPIPIPIPIPKPTPIPTPIYSAPIIITPADGSTMPYSVIEITWQCAGKPISYTVRVRDSAGLVVAGATTSDLVYKLSPERIKPNVKYLLDIGAIYNPTFITNTAGPVSGASLIMPPSYIRWSNPITFSMNSPITVPVIMSPKNGEVLPFADVKATWTAPSGASYYLLTVRRLNITPFIQPVLQFKTTLPNYTIPSKLLTTGTIYNMSVSAFWANDIKSESAAVSFSLIKAITPLPPIEPLTTSNLAKK